MKALRSLTELVARTIQGRGLLTGVSRLGVAVSGGADSVCLLHVLRELGIPCLTVLHLDHGLRGAESRADAAFVAALAERLGLPLIARKASLPSSGNLEQNARRARLAFFREAIASGAVERVATGHTRSDQAETVLFRLLRGAGTAGLAGARPMTADGIVRPLIDVEREQVEEYLTSRQIEWREDSTNSSRCFARNRLRHELLPQLARDWNSAIVAALARTADQAAADEDYWRGEIDRLSEKCLTWENGAILWSLPATGGLPHALCRRLVRRAIERAKGDLLGVDFDHIEQVMRLAASPTGSGRVQAPGLDIRRSFHQIRFGRTPRGSFRLDLAGPGIVRIPGTDRAICLELIEKAETFRYSECVYNGGMGLVDWGRLTGSLCLRSWTPGDRYQPVGSPGIKKLKDLFQIARIPSWERLLWPVLADDRAIVWAGRFGTAAEYAAGPDSLSVLRIHETVAA